MLYSHIQYKMKFNQLSLSLSTPGKCGLSTQELWEGWSIQWNRVWKLERSDASQQQSEETTLEEDPGQ